MNKTTQISHSEYLGDIITSSTIGAFKIQTFPTNPGLGASFPWLSSMATNWDFYVFRDLKFEFKSTSATALNSTNTQLGTVCTRIEHDYYIPVDGSLVQMLNSSQSRQSKPTEDITSEFETGAGHSNKGTVRDGSVSGDYRLADPEGYFEIATQSFQAASVNIGQLWIHYTVIFSRPRYNNGLLGGNIQWYSGFNQAGIVAATPFGTNTGWSGTGTFTPSFTAGGLQILFPVNFSVGFYMLTFNWFGTAAAPALVQPGASAVNGTIINYAVAAPSNALKLAPAGGGNTLSNVLICQYLMQLTAPGALQATFNLNTAGVFPATITFLTLHIQQLNENALPITPGTNSLIY